MNWIALVVLLAVAWYSIEANMTFLTFLSFAGIVLLLFTQTSESHGRAAHDAHHSGNPMIIESTGDEIPSKMNFKIKTHWKDWNTYEYPIYHASHGLDNIGRSLYYLVTGGFGKKKKKGDGNSGSQQKGGGHQ